MTDVATDTGRLNRRVDELELRERRAAGLHGLYAATGLLVGLTLPVANVPSYPDLPERYTLLGLVFELGSDHEVSQPTLVVAAAAALVLTALAAVAALLVAAVRRDRRAASIALAASGLVPVFVVLTSFILFRTELDASGSRDEFETWTSGCWALLIASLAGCWIAAFQRDQFDR